MIRLRRAARNVQWGAVLGSWGQSPHPPETGGWEETFPVLENMYLFAKIIEFWAYILLNINAFKTYIKLAVQKHD